MAAQLSRPLETRTRRLTIALACFFPHRAQAPEICALYALDVPPSTLRAKFRTQFEKNKTVKDLAVLDLMLLKAQQEYQETMNGWKQVPHIMKWFAEEEVSTKHCAHRYSFQTPRQEASKRIVGLRLCKIADRPWKTAMEADSSIALGFLLSCNQQGPARPEGFLEKFYASRDEGRGPIGTGI